MFFIVMIAGSVMGAAIAALAGGLGSVPMGILIGLIMGAIVYVLIRMGDAAREDESPTEITREGVRDYLNDDPHDEGGRKP